MATLTMQARVESHRAARFLQVLVVGLTFATAAIHASLGGLLFMANAVGYTTLAVALLVPGPIAGYRWLIRAGLIGFTMATIAGWVLFGARFQLAYIDKAIEVLLVATASFEMWRADGGPLAVARRALGLVHRIVAMALPRMAR